MEEFHDKRNYQNESLIFHVCPTIRKYCHPRKCLLVPKANVSSHYITEDHQLINDNTLSDNCYPHFGSFVFLRELSALRRRKIMVQSQCGPDTDSKLNQKSQYLSEP